MPTGPAALTCALLLASGGVDAALEIGARTGFALPLGDATGADAASSPQPLRDIARAFVPALADAGLRFERGLFVGASFQYGLGLFQRCPTGSDCAVGDVGLSVVAGLRLDPSARATPSLDIGLGYEWLNTRQNATTGQLRGPQVLVESGVDFALAPGVWLGPFLRVSVGRYDHASSSALGFAVTSEVPNTSFHELLLVGIRGSVDLP